MLDPKSLFSEVKKLVPQYSDKEIKAGIEEFAQAHPNFTNQQALQALNIALAQQKQPVAPTAAPKAPFEGLIGQLGAK